MRKSYCAACATCCDMNAGTMCQSLLLSTNVMQNCDFSLVMVCFVSAPSVNHLVSTARVFAHG